eukprot:GHRR01016412.1.p1 GENE.GHRR01016412.1~~GHRR01016412.1.p1  ORF type:complete len:427 (+),score=106.52 GHRR01016412.1:593-1873(+)
MPGFNQLAYAIQNVAGLGSGLFFVGYSLTMIPSQLILMHIGAPRWLACIVTTWGLTAMCFAFMTNKWQFYGLRTLLGMAESGAFPGLWHYLNSFYPPDAIIVPYSMVEAAVGVANVAGAPLAASLLTLDGTKGMKGWQWLYLLEGIPSIGTGIAMAYMLPKDFHSAKFLSATDKAWLAHTHTANREHLQKAKSAGWVQLLMEAASNRRVWLVALAGICKNAALVGMLFWCPTIVDSLLKGSSLNLGPSGSVAGGAGLHHGHRRNLLGSHDRQPGDRGVSAVLLTAIPFVSAAVCAVWLGHRSQQRKEMSKHIAVPYFIAAVLFVAFPYIALCGGVWSFVCLTLAITALTSPNAVLNSLAAAVSHGPASAVSLALYNAVANLGGLLGPWLIGRVVQATGMYGTALQALGVMVAAAGGLSWYMKRWGL